MPVPLDVLIVDDDQNMRLSLAEILREDGYGVRTASSGEEAVELCQRFTFRLILMDVRMPGIDGVEAFRQIRKHCIRSQIVLMSAYANTELADEAVREGVLRFLPKPLDIEAVLRLIADITGTAVLYVGASPEQADSLHQALGASRFCLTLAGDVEEALSLAAQISYHVMVLDLDPAEMQDAVAKIRASLPGLQLVLTSAEKSTGTETSTHARQDGIRGELSRPVKIEELITLLEELKRERLGTKRSPGSGNA